MSSELTLYNLEDDLASLIETEEGGVPAEVAEQFRQELAETLRKATGKRDKVSAFIRHLEAQAAFAGQEAQRLSQRKRFFENAAERMRGYVRWVIEQMGPDEKGAWRKLEGRISTLSLRKCPDAVEITDEAVVPAEFKWLDITVRADLWEKHLERCTDRSIVKVVDHVEVRIDKRKLLEALREGAVPGAGLRPTEYSLQVK
jgi:hypothetical protein